MVTKNQTRCLIVALLLGMAGCGSESPPAETPQVTEQEAIAAFKEIGGDVRPESPSGDSNMVLLGGTKVTDVDLKKVKAIDKVTMLILDNTPISDAGLIHLRSLSGLFALGLSDTRVSDAGLSHVEDLTKLTNLSLAGTRVTGAGLVHLKRLTKLGTLNLNNTHSTNSGLVHLRGLSKLGFLNLANTDVNDTGLDQLRGLSSLKLVELSGTQVTAEGVAKLRADLPDCRIDYVPMKLNGVGNKQAGQTETYSLQAEKETTAAIMKLGGQARKSRSSDGFDVYEVNLSKSTISDQQLAQLRSLPDIYILRLSDTQIGDAGLMHLKTQTKLGMLLLRNTRVTDNGLVHLAALNTLYGLDLGGTRVSDAGMAYIQRLSELTTLYLSETQLGDNGAKHLKGLKKLKILDLTGTQVTDAALVHLKGFSSLEILSVQDTKVTAQGVGELQAALPNCKIRFKLPAQNVSQDNSAGTYTYYTIPASMSGKVVQASVDVSVHQMAESIVKDGKLFFPAMQVNLGPKVRGENDGGHIGLQIDGGAIATNWGGYFSEGVSPVTRFPPFYRRNTVPKNENTPGSKIKYNMIDRKYGSYDVLVEHFDPGTYTQVNRRDQKFFDWKTGQWYRFVVFRGDKKKGDYWPWLGFIKDLSGEPYKSYFIGTLYSKADHIESFVVWVETNFNDDRMFDVRFIYPKYRTTTSRPLDLTQSEVQIPSLGPLAVSKNRHNTVVVPNREFAEGAARTTWHRNGLPVPIGAYKSKKQP